MKDPDIYLNLLGIELSCAVNEDMTASIDSLHRILVNWEAYFTSTNEAKAQFHSRPYEYTGLVTDPVSHHRFQPKAESSRAEHVGRLFFFESAENAKIFSGDPDRYAVPMIAMRRIEE